MPSKKNNPTNKPSHDHCVLANAMVRVFGALVKKWEYYREIGEAYKEIDPEAKRAYNFKADGVHESLSRLGDVLERVGLIEIKKPETPEQRILKAIFEDAAKAQKAPAKKKKPTEPKAPEKKDEPAERKD